MPRIAVVAVAATLGATLVACGGGGNDSPSVYHFTYEVTGDGSADITYMAFDDNGASYESKEKDVTLPWSSTIDVPSDLGSLDANPEVRVVFDKRSVSAQCSIEAEESHPDYTFSATTFTGDNDGYLRMNSCSLLISPAPTAPSTSD